MEAERARRGGSDWVQSRRAFAANQTFVTFSFVFFVIVYVLALIKAQSLRYFAFSLLAILMAFSGKPRPRQSPSEAIVYRLFRQASTLRSCWAGSSHPSIWKRT
jgi:hypothetical protein